MTSAVPDAMMLPFARLLGMVIDSAAAERVIGRMTVRPDLCTAGQAVHGGALMAFADTLGATAAFLALPKGAAGTTTLESKTNFLGAAREGSELVGECTPVHTGRRTSVWQTRIATAEGKPVALVIQTQIVL